MKQLVLEESERIINFLRGSQSSDGAWNFCYESGVVTDAYLIILLRTLEINDEALIKQLVYRLKRKQEKNGAWKLYQDEEGGNLSATVEAYFALLYSGYCQANEHGLLKAREFILANGGIGKTGNLTKVMLALTGQYIWPNYLKIPIEIILLPLSFPINFFDFVGYARVHFVPVMVCANKKYVIKNPFTPNIAELAVDQEKNNHVSAAEINFLNKISREIALIPREIRSQAYSRAEQFLLKRIEHDGTLYSYFSSTFLMIFALLALGYHKHSPVIIKAVNGLKSFMCNTGETLHIQNTTSTIWDSALTSYALQAAGVEAKDPVIKKSGQFLLKKQQKSSGDWSIHNPRVKPGGWGFSRSNTINPDVDDTTAALRAIYILAKRNPSYKKAFQRGVNWLLSMQNNDGGWPAFEKNTNKKILARIPIEDSESVTTDQSSADLTGRTLEFLGRYAGLTIAHPQIYRAFNWLISNQEQDGSWYGRWGICYIYGTWAAITGMKAVGVNSNHPAIKKANQWLLSIQNPDGGFGESCKSDIEKHYIPLQVSTPSQTAWAIDALIAIHNYPSPAINNGITTLTKLTRYPDWRSDYPTGAGLPGSFYTNYHSYKYIWPLLALSHYKNKFLR